MDRSVYKFIYSFAPTEFLQNMTNQKAREMATLSPGMSDDNQLAEAGGILDAYNERKKETYKPTNIVINACCKTADEYAHEHISDMEMEAGFMMNSWIGDQLRPELLAEKTCALLEFCYSKISCISIGKKNSHKEEMQKKLLEVFIEFHETYFSLINAQQYYAESIRQMSYSQNMTGTTGLGFGLITNSISHALLYDFMNAREHNKQYQRNIYNYRNSVNLSMAHSASDMRIKVEALYDQLIENLDDFFKELFCELKELVTPLKDTSSVKADSSMPCYGSKFFCIDASSDNSCLSTRFLEILKSFENLAEKLEEVFHIKEKFGKTMLDYLNQDIVAFMAYLVIDDDFSVTEKESKIIGRVAGRFFDGMTYADIVNNSKFRLNAWKYTTNTDSGALVTAVADALQNDGFKTTLKSQLKECGNELIICNGYFNDRALNRMNAFFD